MARVNGTSRGAVIRGGGLRGRSVPIEFDVRTAHDFALSVCGVSGEMAELLPQDREWLEEARGCLPAEMRPGADTDEQRALAYACELGAVLVHRPELRTGRDLAKAVEQMSDRELTESILGELLERPEYGTLTRRAIDGSKTAYAELCAILEQQKGATDLCADLDVLAPTVRTAVAAWVEPFESVEARVGRMIERDAANWQSAATTMPSLDLVERVTNGIRLVPDARMKRIVLAPSYFGRPYNSLSEVGDAELIAYPIGDEALDAADRLTPPQSMLRLYRALGDESRLRILRLLTERDWYLTELATELGLSKPTTKHHLAQLRSAGLVMLTEEGGLTYYSLRRDRIAEAGSELGAFLVTH